MRNDESDRPDAETTEEAASPSRRQRLRRILIVVAAIAIIGGLGWYAYHRMIGRFMQSTEDAYVQADAVVVSPKVTGYVDKVFVAENQQVRAGQPLVQIDPRDYRAQTSQIRAQIDVAGASLEGVRAQISEQQAAVAEAEAALAAALSDASFARGQVARYAPLAASGAESREKLSELETRARQADAQASRARAALVAARRRIDTLGAQANQARSQGEAARAQLDAAKVNLGATLIRASINGRIGDKSIRVGQLAQAGTRLMSIVPTQHLYVEANFKETQLGLMGPGQPVTLEIDALPDVELHGRVESLAPGTGAQFSLIPPQNATGNFTKIVQRVPVRISVEAGPDTLALLLPGMSVHATVDTRSAAGSLQRIRDEQEARGR
ncbi:multidrug ABC transporter permease [Sphingomonas sp. Root710]|nr:multidrug ABC transporter permease [Sphingomonas sp. Root710]